MRRVQADVFDVMKGGRTMRRLLMSLFVLMLLVTTTSGLAMAAWADYFPSPQAIGPGAIESPGTVLNTLSPELKFAPVGSISYVYVYDANDSQLTLAEQLSNYRTPVLMVQVNASSLQIPSGVLLPGKNYYWYVESIHAPGTKSEATKTSQRLYFSTAADAK